MLNNITWSSYWTALTILTVIYYVIILLVFYRHELGNLLTGKIGSPHGRTKSTHANLIEDTSQQGNDKNELLPMVAIISDELTAYLEQGSYTRYEKPEVIYALQKITRKFAAIKGSKYQTTINQLIQSVCGDKCGIHLDDSEIQAVWKW